MKAYASRAPQDTHEHGEMWRLRAACADLPNPDLMFPTSHSPAAANAAKHVCAQCPVLTECLTWIMQYEGNRGRHDRHGIYAGLTGPDRYRLYLAAHHQTASKDTDAPAAAPPHKGGRHKAPCGTYSAYQRHNRYGEPIDDACRDAHNAKRREQRASAKAA